jgi:3-deoxy-7-phosphoheptulonate synthase
MVDCSHANSGKQHARQEEVWRNVIQQRAAGRRSIIGVMVESNLEEGNQPFPQDPARLRYGVSITDACIGWDETREALAALAEAVRARRLKRAGEA